MANVQSNDKLNEELKSLPNDEEFKHLQDILGGINFLKLSGMGRQETKHSYFLFNLFDPNGVHGWGYDFAKDFLENGLKLHLPQCFYTGLMAARKEYKFKKNNKRVDLLLYSNDTVVLIENKVDAALSDNQLGNYEEGINFDNQFSQHKKIYIFLTPEGRLPDSDHIKTWKPATYGQIIDSLLRVQGKHPPKTQDEQQFNLFLNHYIKYLRNEVIKNVKTLDRETKMLYDSLVKKYPEATAFLGLQRSDEKLDSIYDAIAAILEMEKDQRKLILNGKKWLVKRGEGGKGRIQFVTENIRDLLGLIPDEKSPFIYEISADNNQQDLQAYAYARNYDLQDPKIKDLFEACKSYEENHNRATSAGKEARKLKFDLEVNVDDMFGKLQVDNSELTVIIHKLLDDIKNAEKKLEETIAELEEKRKKTAI